VVLLEAGGRTDNWVATTPGALVLMIAGKGQQLGARDGAAAGLNGRI
jgi:hypothetical protein